MSDFTELQDEALRRAEAGDEPQPRSRRRSWIQAAGLVVGLAGTLAIVVLLALPLIDRVVLPTAANGDRCFVWDPGTCTELSVDGVESRTGVVLPAGSTVVEASTRASLLSLKLDAVVALPTGETFVPPDAFTTTKRWCAESGEQLDVIGLSEFDACYVNRSNGVSLRTVADGDQQYVALSYDR